MVRASRNLPIRLVAGEYERILRRRMVRVGGSPDDAGLQRVLDMFKEETLPASIKAGSSVRKGTVLTFSRDNTGRLFAKANDCVLGSVVSPKLCHAIFDLYLGDQPVSRKARSVAGESVCAM